MIPERTDDPAEARSLLDMDGAAVLRWDQGGGEAATAAARAVLGDRLRALRAPVAIGTNPQADEPTFFDPATRIVNANSRSSLSLHVDGYMLYGAAYPDVVFLLCDTQADVGGDSFAVDGYRLLARLGDDPDQRDLLRFLWHVPLEQSTPSGVPVRNPIADRTPGGRIAIRAHAHQRQLDGSDHDPGAERLLERWRSLVGDAARGAPRFRLQPGEFLCIDNYRVFHGRDPYQEHGRLLHRIWSWTRAAHGLPDLSGDRRARLVDDLTVLDHPPGS